MGKAREVVVVCFEFGQEKFRLRFIKSGCPEVRRGPYLTFECERCSEAVSYDINVKPCIRPGERDDNSDCPVAGPPRAPRPEPMESLLVTNQRVTLTELIEEELLLSLPMSPKHEQCHTLELERQWQYKKVVKLVQDAVCVARMMSCVLPYYPKIP
ncbi:YceD family protein [Coxiella-like endosymbiont]|uniref:YceD family protein n=1 Tax=Coxiella-like endosymbiont TaxID=1592897 RepID=UPI0034E242F6